MISESIIIGPGRGGGGGGKEVVCFSFCLDGHPIKIKGCLGLTCGLLITVYKLITKLQLVYRYILSVTENENLFYEKKKRTKKRTKKKASSGESRTRDHRRVE